MTSLYQRRARRLFALAAAGGLALAACGGGDDAAEVPTATQPTTATTQPSTTPSVTDQPPATGQPTTTVGDAAASAVPAALDFTAPLVGGGEIEMGAYAGRPVLLWFWAPW